MLWAGVNDPGVALAASFNMGSRCCRSSPQADVAAFSPSLFFPECGSAAAMARAFGNMQK
jgi:hypothetical protein